MVVTYECDLFCFVLISIDCCTICYLFVSNLIYHLLFSKSIHSATFQILSFLFISIEKSRNSDPVPHFSRFCIAWSLNPIKGAWITKVIWTVILTEKSGCGFFCKPSPELCLLSKPVKNLHKYLYVTKTVDVSVYGARNLITSALSVVMLYEVYQCLKIQFFFHVRNLLGFFTCMMDVINHRNFMKNH